MVHFKSQMRFVLLFGLTMSIVNCQHQELFNMNPNYLNPLNFGTMRSYDTLHPAFLSSSSKSPFRNWHAQYDFAVSKILLYQKQKASTH